MEIKRIKLDIAIHSIGDSHWFFFLLIPSLFFPFLLFPLAPYFCCYSCLFPLSVYLSSFHFDFPKHSFSHSGHFALLSSVRSKPLGTIISVKNKIPPSFFSIISSSLGLRKKSGGIRGSSLITRPDIPLDKSLTIGQRR